MEKCFNLGSYKKIASNKLKPGTSFYVSIANLWSTKEKLEEVSKNISEGRGTKSSGETPIVTKSLQLRSAFFIMDGHHRIMRDVQNGNKEIYVQWNSDFPYLDAGIGNELPSGYMKIVDFIKNQKAQ